MADWFGEVAMVLLHLVPTWRFLKMRVPVRTVWLFLGNIGGAAGVRGGGVRIPHGFALRNLRNLNHSLLPWGL